MFILNNLSLVFPHKVCFQEFNATINVNNHIGIIGRNGYGKSSLLRIIHEKLGDNISFLVPQIISDYPELSGGERFNKKLSEAMAIKPQVLLLDKPTNHLDYSNRYSLLRMLEKYNGALLVVTHDSEILRSCIDIIWYINNGEISVFNGKYDKFLLENERKLNGINKKLLEIKHKEKNLRIKLQKEQERQAHSITIGKKYIRNKKWLKAVGDLKAMSSEKSRGKILQNLSNKKSDLLSSRAQIFIPKENLPKFSFPDSSDNSCFSIVNGAIGYSKGNFILENIDITLNQSLAVIGPNASGKTTLVKAILNDPKVFKTGLWNVPKNITYLDQHYSTLNPDKSAIETIHEISNLSNTEIRRFLNDFLFKKTEEINVPSRYLSGGEKARLCLAQIAISTPSILILDEITNNIDIETRDYIIDLLKNYKGKFIIISHDNNFLQSINIKDIYNLKSESF